ncbi:MAG: class I SAM-dependent methyltransferase [Pedobacter sp.]|nr:MAG: class I SAM-dependent methyltransferase [Pedobacter sp.]
MKIAFESKLPADPQKLRGGYYTPALATEYLVNWAIRSGEERILEPSCGDGNFLLPITKRVAELRPDISLNHPSCVTAVEVEPNELNKAQNRVDSSIGLNVPIEWIGDDFFRAYPVLQAEKFDVVLGNPPFIRFQYFQEESRDIAFGHLRDAGYKPTKLANAWAAFVQLSIELLKPGGRLAMVLPAELLQVQYASELRSRFVASFEHIVLIGFKQLIFPEIQQEVVLLLAEGKRENPGDDCEIHTIDINDASELAEGVLENQIAHTPARHSRKGMKWTSLYLSESAFSAIDKAENHPELTRLSVLADVEVGVVTGLNSFFVIDSERVRDIGAENFSTPVVGKTSALKGLSFGVDEFRAYREKYPSYLLNFNGIPKNRIPSGVHDYIAHGESAGAHKGYKCSIRKRWIDVPSIYIPDGFLFRQIHGYPLLVLNEVNATSTDTIHRVRVKEDINPRLLSASFVNSLTFAWAEVAGRSYGGGVLELEPREAQGLPIPYFPDCDLDFNYINELIRSDNIEAALDYVDQRVLINRLGFSLAETIAMRTAWHELRNRRINRR